METKIKEFRNEKGLSQQKLADLTGVTRQTINALENARYNPSLLLAFRITKILDKENIEDVFIIDDGEWEMILDIYKDSFEYASKNVKNLLILGVFYLFGFLVIPMFFILGYNYRIIKIATEGMINGDDELPEFENWTLMLVEGIKCFVVYLGYLIIPILVFLGIL